MTRTKTLLRALLGVGAAGAIAAFGTFSAFSSTTENDGNKIATGTVVLTDNAGPADTIINTSTAKPGADMDRCIRVAYTGTLPADVAMYVPTEVGPLADHIDLEITPGSYSALPGTFGSCTTFSEDAAGSIYGDGPGGNATLGDFQNAEYNWANSLLHNPGADLAWTNGEVVVYRFRFRVRETAAQNAATNDFTVRFEAQNQ